MQSYFAAVPRLVRRDAAFAPVRFYALFFARFYRRFYRFYRYDRNLSPICATAC